VLKQDADFLSSAKTSSSDGVNRPIMVDPMSMVKRFYAALGANMTGQVMTTLIQLVTVPAFLYCWSLSEYGSWLILTAVPAYFALSDIGFLAVTINKMTIVAASGDTEKVNILFQTAFKLCQTAALAGTLLALIVVFSLNVKPLDSLTSKAVLVILVFSAVLAMSSGLLDAVFRSSGEFALGMHLVNGARFIEWIGMLCGLFLGRTFLSTAIGQLAGRLVASLIGWKIASRRYPNIQWGVSKASAQELREMARPALSFMAFPVANAVNIQGMTLVVGHLFGVAFLAIFSTYRTLTRILVQAVTIIGRSLWPEISRRFGVGDMRVLVDLYRKGTFASIGLAAGLCFFLYYFGETLLHLWTRGRIPFEKSMFDLFLVAAMITSFWQMGMVLLAATNRHPRLSITYLLGSIMSILVTYTFSGVAGTQAPMIGLIGFEVFLVVMCSVHVRAFKRNMQVAI